MSGPLAPLALFTCDAARPMASVVASRLGTELSPGRALWFACGEGKFVI